jgi:DNA-directed RNA polymerase specialized sigma24 family protein
MQEALLQVWLSLGRLRGPDRFRSWLHGIVLNVARAARRREPAATGPLVGNEMLADPYLRW